MGTSRDAAKSKGIHTHIFFPICFYKSPAICKIRGLKKVTLRFCLEFLFGPNGALENDICF